MTDPLDDIAAARKLVSAVCKDGDRAWRMCVPPQPGDADMLLTRVLDRAAAAEEEVRQLRAMLAAVSDPPPSPHVYTTTS